MKKLGLVTVALSALLLSGCGGDSKSKSMKEQMQERDVIVIAHAYPEEVCKSQELKDIYKNNPSVKNVLISVEDDTVDCNYYGRVNGSNTCAEATYGGYPKACVVAADYAATDKRVINNSMIEAIQDAILEEL